MGGQASAYAPAVEPAIVLALVVLAMAMFAWEKVPLEVASLALIAALALTGVLTPAEAFAGISHETVIFIFTLLAMTQGLAATGVMQLVGRRAAFVRGLGERSLLVGLLGTVAAFSSVASNTAVTAAFLPVASASAARAGIPRSRVLLPMAYASMLGGMVLLFGTSTNLVVSAAMTDLGMPPLGFAELAPVGLPAALLGIASIVATRHLLLPAADRERLDPPIGQRAFVTEAVVPAGSRLAGRAHADLGPALGLELLGIVRHQRWIPPASAGAIAVGDRLFLRGSRRELLRIRDLRSLVLQAELLLPPSARGGRTVLAEAYLPAHSPLAGRTVREFRFAERLGLHALAVHRHPAGVEAGVHPVVGARSVGDVALAAGDVLLLSGPADRLRELEDGGLLSILGSESYLPPRYRKAALALLLFALSVGAAGAGLVPPAIAGLLGMLAMIATRCVDAGDAFRVEWRVVLLVGSLLSLGAAMEKSGAGALVAEWLVPLAGTLGPRGVLFQEMALTVPHSAPMSNQAAALVVLPVAVHLAEGLGLAPRPFAIATCLAGSCSFVTPLEPSAALVFGPGHYRFSDFLRAGTPLTLALLALFTWLIPLVWPL